MIAIQSNHEAPIYRQIADQIMLLVSSGILSEGEAIPSIRDLARDLGINPATVARAYAELERRGIIETLPKKGSYIARGHLKEELRKKAQEDLTAFIERYRSLAFSQDDLIAIVKEVYAHAGNSITQ